jgi:MFS family permease
MAITSETLPSDAIGDSSAYPKSSVAWYSVCVMMLMYIFSFIDRQIISLLVEPMKRDLHITDTQVGMLQGLAFALLYTFLGLPIARLSDRYNRKAIIAGGVLIWSLMATLCGLAKTALQLFMARVGVGIGEATLSPAAYSMITDSFPRAKLGRAFAIYTVAIPIGSGIALLVGGIVVGAVSGAGDHFTLPILGEVRAWQLVFIVTGAPGLLLPLLLLTFKEPVRRGLLTNATGGAAPRASVREVVSYAVKNGRLYSMHATALGLLALGGYAVGAWLPTALARAYPISVGDIGKVTGISTIFVNTTGMIFAGILCDRLTRRGFKDAAVVVALISAIGISIFSSLPPIMPSVAWVYTAIVVSGLTFHGYNGVGPMAINQITPNQYRAQLSAAYLFVVNILGLGVGPWLVPFINDHLFHDPVMIRYSLMMVVFGSAVLAALLLWLERPLYRAKQTEMAQWQ